MLGRNADAAFSEVPDEAVAEPLPEELTADACIRRHLLAELRLGPCDNRRGHGGEGCEMVVLRQIRDLHRVDVVVRAAGRTGIVRRGSVTRCQIVPDAELELSVTLQEMGGIELPKKGC